MDIFSFAKETLFFLGTSLENKKTRMTGILNDRLDFTTKKWEPIRTKDTTFYHAIVVGKKLWAIVYHGDEDGGIYCLYAISFDFRDKFIWDFTAEDTGDIIQSTDSGHSVYTSIGRKIYQFDIATESYIRDITADSNSLISTAPWLGMFVGHDDSTLFVWTQDLCQVKSTSLTATMYHQDILGFGNYLAILAHMNVVDPYLIFLDENLKTQRTIGLDCLGSSVAWVLVHEDSIYATGIRGIIQISKDLEIVRKIIGKGLDGPLNMMICENEMFSLTKAKDLVWNDYINRSDLQFNILQKAPISGNLISILNWRGAVFLLGYGDLTQWTPPKEWSQETHCGFAKNRRKEVKEFLMLHAYKKIKMPIEIALEICKFISHTPLTEELWSLTSPSKKRE